MYCQNIQFLLYFDESLKFAEFINSDIKLSEKESLFLYGTYQSLLTLSQQIVTLGFRN